MAKKTKSTPETDDLPKTEAEQRAEVMIRRMKRNLRKSWACLLYTSFVGK